VSWLADNPEVLQSSKAEKIKADNYLRFFTQNDDAHCLQKLDKILEDIKNERRC
jgi:hypothetical protein